MRAKAWPMPAEAPVTRQRRRVMRAFRLLGVCRGRTTLARAGCAFKPHDLRPD
jgi:hypothetical protein